MRIYNYIVLIFPTVTPTPKFVWDMLLMSCNVNIQCKYITRSFLCSGRGTKESTVFLNCFTVSNYEETKFANNIHNSLI